LLSSFVLFFVLIGVRLRGFLSVVSSMQMVAMRDMGMMSALFMRSFFVMSGRLLVMARCVLVMFSGLLMMFRSFMLWHLGFSSFLYRRPDSSESTTKVPADQPRSSEIVQYGAGVVFKI
jgi:hypothetical protein